MDILLLLLKFHYNTNGILNMPGRTGNFMKEGESLKRKRLRHGFAMVGLAILIFCLTACGKQNDTEKSTTSYVASFFGIPDEVTGISRMLIKGDTAYMCCSEESGISYLASMSMDDGNFQKQPMEMEESAVLLDFAFDVDGNIWIVCMAQADSYCLKRYDESGREIQSVDLMGILKPSDISGAARCLFLSIDAEGNICVAEKSGSTSAYLFDSSGQFLFSLHHEGNLLSAITTAEGQIGVCTSSADRLNYELLTVDMKGRDWSKNKVYLGATIGLYGGASSFYRYDSSSLFGYSVGSGEGKHIFNWSDVGLSASEVHLGELSDGRLVILAASPDQTETFSYEMAVLSQGMDERTVLSMVSLSASPGVVQAVSDFNKTNSQYRVELTEYFPYEQNVSDEEWNNAVLNLNIRIISGNMPDILDMSNLPVQVYHNKGMLENLYAYMENDPAIQMDDYFENVFKAISINGKLPYITDGIGISTMLANAELINDRTGWTLQKLKDVLNAYGANSISNLTGTFFLKVMLQADDHLVDWDAGKCFFDSPEFVKLLEFAREIQNSSQNSSGEDSSSGSVAAYQAVLTVYHITQYRDYYHGNLELPGLPGSNGGYHALMPEIKIGISSASQKKEGAWEFVRTFLSEEHQKSCIMLPIHKGAFETVMQAALDGKSAWKWLYENGNAITEDVELTKMLLSSAEYVVSGNQILENIVLEEAQDYFSGAGSAQEAAEKIQKRVSLYINEQM